jgi:hypothetical protein
MHFQKIRALVITQLSFRAVLQTLMTFLPPLLSIFLRYDVGLREITIPFEYFHMGSKSTALTTAKNSQASTKWRRILIYYVQQHIEYHVHDM